MSKKSGKLPKPGKAKEPKSVEVRDLELRSGSNVKAGIKRVCGDSDGDGCIN
jgi:hypothetical protein